MTEVMAQTEIRTLPPPTMGDAVKKPAPPHKILATRQFEQLGSNDKGVQVIPSIIHFGGYSVHREHLTQVRVLNTSATSIRLTILNPSTKSFKISYEKKGILAPGMSEDIAITFYPTEWRYYYDTVKVFCDESQKTDGGNIVIPMHGYPAVNDLRLPRFIDFGNVPMGTSRTKILPLHCSIPIEFEFEITIKQDHEDFEMTPMKGIIPANGTLNVAFTYLPTKACTSVLSLAFNLAQFDANEVLIDVVGNCFPDTQKDELIMLSMVDLENIKERRRQEELRERVLKLKQKKNSGMWKPPEVKMPKFDSRITEEDMIVKDVPVPRTDNQSSCNFVLKQKPGKLPLKAFRAFVIGQREKADAKLMKALQNSDEDEGDCMSDDDVNAKEIRFELKWRDTETYDKGKELKGISEIGENSITEKDCQKTFLAREKKHEMLIGRTLENCRTRTETTMTQANNCVPLSYEGENKAKLDEYANDSFAMRLQVIDRFVRAGSKCAQRVRATARLKKLQEAMGLAGAKDRETTKAWVESENKAAAMGGKRKTDASSGGTCMKMPKTFVLPPRFPTSVQSMTKGRDNLQPAEAEMVDTFIDYEVLKLNPKHDFLLEAYHPIPQPPPSQYMRPNTGRRQAYLGALEELYVRGPCGNERDGCETPMSMPSNCLSIPYHDPMQVCVPSPNVRAWLGSPYDFCETDLEFRLSEPLPQRPWKEREDLVLETIENRDPWISTWRLQRHLIEPLGTSDPFPESLAPGREKQGPLMGGDASGGSLGMLQHGDGLTGTDGGRHFDIPSDTDSDDRDEDFDIPRPNLETYLGDFFANLEEIPGLDDPIIDERAKLEQELESKLEQDARARNCGFRKKLIEFNDVLDYRNKLYLG